MSDESLFWSIFTPGPVLENVATHLEINSIIALSRTCRSLSGLYAELMPRQWDVDKLLRRFVAEPKLFRTMLGHASGLICGDFALCFFERRGHEQLTECDLVLVKSKSVDKMTKWLCRSEEDGGQGYVDGCGKEEGVPWDFKHFGQVVQLTRRRDNGEVKRIRMFVIDSESYRKAHPIRAVLDGCWNTSMVNFISYKTAYSIFPAPTFLHRKSYLLEAPYGSSRTPFVKFYPIQKYMDAGFRLSTSVPSPQPQPERTCMMRKCRKIADRMSWKIPLNTLEIELATARDPVDPEDVFFVTENVATVEPEVEAYFSSVLSHDREDMMESIGYGRMHYYQLNYLRYSGFFT